MLYLIQYVYWSIRIISPLARTGAKQMRVEEGQNGKYLTLCGGCQSRKTKKDDPVFQYHQLVHSIYECFFQILSPLAKIRAKHMREVKSKYV